MLLHYSLNILAPFFDS